MAGRTFVKDGISYYEATIKEVTQCWPIEAIENMVKQIAKRIDDECLKMAVKSVNTTPANYKNKPG